MWNMGGCVYILTTVSNTALYTGVTAHLLKRMLQHRQHDFPASFTGRYHCTKLVYYRTFDGIEAAITEEKRIKGGSRLKKIKLIESINPDWKDLFEEIAAWDWR